MKKIHINLITALYIIILFFLASLKHFLLSSSTWDLGIFEQFSWLIANSRVNEISSIRGIAPLEDHFSLLLFPIGLIYKIIPSTYTLIGMQSIGIGCLFYLILSFARQRVDNQKIYLSILISLLLCPYLFLVNLRDFHPEVVIVPIMFLAATEVTSDNKYIYYPLLLISLFAKKSQVLFGLGLSIYAFIKGKKSKAISTLLISLSWWSISSRYSAVSGDYIAARLGYLGENNLEIVTTLVTSPWKIFNESPPDSIFLYIFGLTLPFLAILNKRAIPSLIATLPVLITNIISSSGIQIELNHHYSIAIMPFILIGCLESLEEINVNKKQVVNRIYYTTIVLSIIGFLGYARIGYFASRYIPRLEESISLHKVKVLIPSSSSLLTSKDYAPHFANRDLVKYFGYGNKFSINENYLPLSNYDYIVMPERDNYVSKKGKLRLLRNTFGDSHREAIIKEAANLSFECNKMNEHITLCSKEGS